MCVAAEGADRVSRRIAVDKAVVGRSDTRLQVQSQSVKE